MDRMGRFDARGLKKLQSRLRKLQDTDTFIVLCAKKFATGLLRMDKHRTALINGTLCEGWTVKEIRKEGNVYRVDITNTIEYAPYVEYEYRRKVGSYASAIEKRLKKSWVCGQLMSTIYEQEPERISSLYWKVKPRIFGGSV